MRQARLSFSFLYFGPRVLERHASAFAALAGHGYGGAEVPVAAATEAELGWLGRTAADHGLALSAVGLLSSPHDPLDARPSVRTATIDRLRELLDRSAAIGADVLAGPLHSAYGSFTGQPPTESEFAACVEVFQAVAPHAAAVGVKLALEPLNRFECYFLNTVADTARLVRAVGHQMVVAAVDTHHAHIEEADPTAAILEHGDTLGHVQLSENHRGVPGRGQVDFAAILAALDRIGYRGWFVIEAFSRQDPEFGSALRIWRELDQGLDEVLAAGAHLLRARGRTQ
ncbi:MAG: sugar phosphate isomerase/epimerase family protein [Planctomycetota bacterium]